MIDVLASSTASHFNWPSFMILDSNEINLIVKLKFVIDVLAFAGGKCVPGL